MASKNPRGYGKALRGSVMRMSNALQKQGYSRSEAIREAWRHKGRVREYFDERDDDGAEENPTGFKMKPWMWLALGVGAYLVYTKVIKKPTTTPTQGNNPVVEPPKVSGS